jgi:hypothetical protein
MLHAWNRKVARPAFRSGHCTYTLHCIARILHYRIVRRHVGALKRRANDVQGAECGRNRAACCVDRALLHRARLLGSSLARPMVALIRAGRAALRGSVQLLYVSQSRLCAAALREPVPRRSNVVCRLHYCRSHWSFAPVPTAGCVRSVILQPVGAASSAALACCSEVQGTSGCTHSLF